MNQTPYYSVNQYYKKIFGEKAYKISIDAGFTCPNRDGTLGHRGCIFCSEGGSGDFAPDSALLVSEQINRSIKLISQKYTGHTYIAYFQAFTNTYAPVTKLRKLYYEAINDSRISGISIATRPDCLSNEVIELLTELKAIKPVWVELGFQTSNEKTATYIRRGYKNNVFDDAVNRLHIANIPVIAHMIVGLPGEEQSDYINTARHIASLGISGIKIQLLHILKGTDLATEYEKGEFKALEMDEYIDSLMKIIEIIPPDMVIHRITGDGPKSLLIAPNWSANKKNVLNKINLAFKEHDTWQGKRYKNGT